MQKDRQQIKSLEEQCIFGTNLNHDDADAFGVDRQECLA
jgi:hypothetical protein